MDFMDFINRYRVNFSRFYIENRTQIRLTLQPDTTICLIDNYIIKFNHECNTIINNFNEEFKQFKNLTIELQSLQLSCLMDVLDFKNQVIASFFEIKADIIDNDLKKLFNNFIYNLIFYH